MHCPFKRGNDSQPNYGWHTVCTVCEIVLPERLQLRRLNLHTLEKTRKLVMQNEVVHQHQQFLTANEGAVVKSIIKNNSKPQHRETDQRIPQSLKGGDLEKFISSLLCNYLAWVI